MAIKMTKRGTLPSERTYSGTCKSCGSEYVAQEKDLDYRSDYHDSWYQADCQLCDNIVYFEKDRV